MKYIASVSFGKDSLAMLLRLLEKNKPLDEVVFYDTGMEFQAIYNLRDRIKPLLEERNIQYTELHPISPFDWLMYEKPLKDGVRCGWGWCGGVNRWGTGEKLRTLEEYQRGKCVYVGIAADEKVRIAKERKSNVILPLVEMGMTEDDCLQYCYDRGWNWLENGVDLYTILDRVSCWCCRNKNLKELRGMYHHLPEYWQKLKNMQSRLRDPMKQSGSVFDLEKRFGFEDERIQQGLSITNQEFYRELEHMLLRKTEI